MTVLTSEPLRFARLREGEAPIVYREARIDDVSVIVADNGSEDRRVVLSFSSEQPVLRVPWWDDPYFEILGHDESEVDLYRLNNGASVFYNHNSYSPAQRLGAVVRAWLEDNRGHAEIKISNREEVDGYWTDIRDGLLTLVSVGYAIHEAIQTKASDTETDEFRITSWEPVEVSLVGVPADPTVGVNRGAGPHERGDPEATNVARGLRAYLDSRVIEDPSMAGTAAQRTDPAPGATPTPAGPTPEEVAAREAEIRKEAARDALAAEQTRQGEIREAFEPYRDEHGTLETTCLNDSTVTANDARKRLLDALGKTAEPVGDGNGRVESGEDAKDKYREGARIALFARCGLQIDGKKPDLRGNEFASYRLSEMARQSLRVNNLSTMAADPLEMVGRAFHSTSDFPHILGETSRVSLGIGWEEAPETYDLWTGRGNLSDFKIHKRVSLSSYSDLVKVPEGGEYQYGTFTDEGEPVSLLTYGSLFAITRQAVINDDLDAFSATPRKQGRAAKRVVGDLVYGSILGNANMADGVPLFDAAHSNIAVNFIGAPSQDSLKEGYAAMTTQTDAQGKVINVEPAFLLCQPSDKLATKQLLESQYDPASPAVPIANPVRNLADVVSDNRMTAAAGGWAMVGAPGTYDTVQVAYLYGNDSPALEEKEGWKVDGVEYKVRIDVGVKPIGWRAMYWNAG